MKFNIQLQITIKAPLQQKFKKQSKMEQLAFHIQLEEKIYQLGIGGPSIDLLTGMRRDHPYSTPCHQILNCSAC